MNEWSSTTIPKPELPPHRPRSSTIGVVVGFILCGIGFLAFPKYAPMLDLATGVFYGIGFIALLFGILTLCIGVFRRTDSRPPRQSSRSGTIGAAVFVMLFGIIFLAFPKYAPMSDLGTGVFYGIGLIVLLLGILTLCVGVFRIR